MNFKTICLNTLKVREGYRSVQTGWIYTRICPAFANSVDPDQLASEEANWSGATLFVIKYVILY